MNTEKILKDISEQMESRLASRVGYMESKHKNEVLKGARIAIAILEEELKRYKMHITWEE